mmetsp:Transcript_2096/g.4946  ORF Transcript_2096/g.4946 Transcript_2096/m.4946 type:complete len:419 (-) Transcript_2096:402-1658(-)
MGGWTVRHQLTQFVDIKGGDPFGHGEVHCHRSGNSYLVNTQVWIGRNDGTCREIDTLSHEISTQSPLLSLETLLDSFERPTAALRDLGHSPDFVVHKGRHIVLECLLELFYNNVRFSVRNGISQRNVALDNIDELMGQIVLRGRSPTHAHTGSNVQGWHRQDLHQQPIGAGVGRVQTQNFHILLLHGLKDLDRLGSAQKLFRVTTGGTTAILVRILGFDVQSDLGEFRLGSLAVLATLDVAQQVVEGVHALSAFLDFRGHLHLVLVHLFLDASAVKTDAPKSLEGCVEISLVVHRPCEFEMTEISRITLVVEVSKTRIVHSSINGLSLNLCLVPGDSGRNLAPIHGDCLSDRVLSKLVRIYNPELQLLDSSETNSRVSKILGGHSERRRSSLFGRHDSFLLLFGDERFVCMYVCFVKM